MSLGPKPGAYFVKNPREREHIEGIVAALVEQMKRNKEHLPADPHMPVMIAEHDAITLLGILAEIGYLQGDKKNATEPNPHLLFQFQN